MGGSRTPVIGVTSSWRCQDEQWYAGVGRTYLDALERAGAAPLVLPPLAEGQEETAAVIPPAVRRAASAWLGRLDGLLLSGGADVDPRFYGEERHHDNVTVQLARDRYELALVQAAVAGEVPIFAICRGIQVLNVALGGTLVQDIPCDVPQALPHRQTAPRTVGTHPVHTAAGSFLATTLGSNPYATNSFHHQAIKDLAPGLVVTAHTPDGIIEAVEHPGRRFLVGVQFHPEDMAAHDPRMRALFAAFVQACT